MSCLLLVITYMVSGDLCRPRYRPPPTSPPSSQSPTPSDIEVRPAKYPCISCVVAQIGYVVAQVAGHVCRLHLRVAYILPEC